MDNKLSELKAAALAATPGPWMKIDYFWIGRAGAINSEFITCDNGPDAEYIKRVSPDAVLALLAELEAKDKRIAELESYVDVGALALSIAELRIYGEDHDNCPTSLSESIDLVLHEFGRNRAELLAKDNHIAELDGILEVSQGDLSDTEDAMHLWAERAKTAEAKLATPVRLPAKVERNPARNGGIADCATALRDFGFTVEGDGE